MHLFKNVFINLYPISGIGTVTDDEFVVCLPETKNFQNVQTTYLGTDINSKIPVDRCQRLVW
jgi:hypothetical protein